jgi:methionyl-tRNA formyltransferase
LRVAFAGTPEFALPALAALCAEHQVIGVLTQPDRPSGRGRRLTASPVKIAADMHHLPLFQPQTLRSEAAHMQLRAWQPDVLVVVAYGLLLPPEVLSLPRFGCLNIHASLLPRWRGAAPVQRAILAGDTQTGISIMQMDAGLDTGPVLLERRIALRRDHTAGTLQAELAQHGAAALLEALAGVAAGTLRAQAQSAAGVSYAPRILKAEARIDWALDAEQIERQVRAFNPAPVAETVLEGEQLRILAARALSAADPPEVVDKSAERDPKTQDPGTIIGLQGDSMLIRCGEGLLGVTEVQRPGRRPVRARDLSHGLPLAGRRLG